MRASALVVLLSCAVGVAGAPGFDPSPSSPTCTTRVDTTGGCSCKPRAEQLQLVHEREHHGRASFAKSWVSRARGGGSKVPADGGGEEKSSAKDRRGGGKAPDEVELALVGNFPNR